MMSDTVTATSSTKQRLYIASDFPCAFCFLAHVNLFRAFQELTTADASFSDRVELLHAPFQLSLTLPATGVDKYKLISDIVGGPEILDAFFDAFCEEYRAMGCKGQPINGGLLGNTMDAHRLELLAQEQGLAEEMTMALFEMNYIKNRNLGNVDLLMEEAAAVGVEGAKEMFATDRFRQEIWDMRQALVAAGVKGVPAYLLANQDHKGGGASGDSASSQSFTKIHAHTIINGIKLSSADVVDSKLTIPQWKELLTNIAKL
jgi:predicted DsbA family dithiol-disulfide isomerase